MVYQSQVSKGYAFTPASGG